MSARLLHSAGEARLLTQPSWDTLNFWVEIALSAAVRLYFLFQSRYRESKTAMFWIALIATLGMSLNRVNVAGLATLSLTKAFYFPAWTEWAVTLGILSGAGLVYFFAVERLRGTSSFWPGKMGLLASILFTPVMSPIFTP